jgi:hypothetical protein
LRFLLPPLPQVADALVLAHFSQTAVRLYDIPIVFCIGTTVVLLPKGHNVAWTGVGDYDFSAGVIPGIVGGLEVIGRLGVSAQRDLGTPRARITAAIVSAEIPGRGGRQRFRGLDFRRRRVIVVPRRRRCGLTSGKALRFATSFLLGGI